MSSPKIATLVGLVTLSLAGCSDGTGPGSDSGPPLTLRVAATPLSPAAQSPESLTVAGHTLVLTRVELVLRDIRLKRADDDESGEYFSTGPMLLDLPLNGRTDKLVTVAVDSGTYRQVEFRLHKPENDGGDAAFLAAHPDLAKLSVRVAGRYDGRGFVYGSDLTAKQRSDLAPALVIGSQTATDVTLKIDVATWFVRAGRLLDPVTALKGQPNDDEVRDNIRRSFRWFKDEDHDGDDDR